MRNVKQFLAAACALSAAVRATAAWQPGLMGGTIEASKLNLTDWPAVTNVYLGPVATTTTALPPWGLNTTWVYWGQMYFNGGTYHFAENIDDATYIAVDGVEILKDATWNGVGRSGDVNLSEGWHAIEMRFVNYGGGAGCSGSGDWPKTMGFGYNVNGADSTSAADYTYPEDDGKMSLFRYDDGLGFGPTLAPSVVHADAESVRLTAQLTFGSEVESTVVTLCWGESDGGEDVASWASSHAWSATSESASFDRLLTGLSSNVVYHARFCARGEKYTAWTPDIAFMPLSAPQIACASVCGRTLEDVSFAVSMSLGGKAALALTFVNEKTGVTNTYDAGEIALGAVTNTLTDLDMTANHLWWATASNGYGTSSSAPASLSYLHYAWTGAAGDNLYGTPGNWNLGASPGAAPTLDVVIDGSNLAEADRLVQFVPPNACFAPKGTVTVRGGATFVQTTSGYEMRFDQGGGTLVVDGGTFNIGTAGYCYLADAVVTSGGVITNANKKTFKVVGTLQMDSGFIGPVGNGEYSVQDGWRITGGKILSLEGILNLTEATAGNWGSTEIRAYGMRIGRSGSQMCAYDWEGGGIVIGRPKTGSWTDGDCWNQYIAPDNGSYINVTPSSLATFTFPIEPSQMYGKTFGTSSSTPKFRLNGHYIDQATFAKYFDLTDFTYEGGEKVGATISLKQKPFLGETAPTIDSADGFDYTATATLDSSGHRATMLYLCYGTSDGGETIDSWAAKIALAVTEKGTYDITIPGDSLSPATTYSWRLIAVNDQGSDASAAATFTSGAAPDCTGTAVAAVNDTDLYVDVPIVAGGIADLVLTVMDEKGDTVGTDSLHVVQNGTYRLHVPGLTACTTYTWKVDVTNGRGSTKCDLGKDSAFTTPAAVDARTAVGSGAWDDPTVWSPVGVPQTANDVTIPGGFAITLDAETAALKSLTVAEGAKVVFSGWDAALSADSVTVDGTLTHVVNSATAANDDGGWTPNGRVNVTCATFTLGATGKIDAKGLGYQGSVLNSRTAGFGPGAAGKNCDGVGGSHGGRAGAYGTKAFKSVNGHVVLNTPAPYDSETEPGEPGSGAFAADGKWGGNGGGVVRIVASGDVTVNGKIDADGTTNLISPGNHWTAGSGGAVYIACTRILGSGAITANGGDAKQSASGAGGGRIAIRYDTAAQSAVALPALRIQAMGGGTSTRYGEYGATYDEYVKTATPDFIFIYGRPHYGAMAGEPGTLWFPDSQLLTRSVEAGVVRLAGRWVAPNAPTSLQAAGDLIFDDGALELETLREITVGGDLKILGHTPTLWNSTAGNIRSQQTHPNQVRLTNCVLSVGGDFIATNAMVWLKAATDVTVRGRFDAWQSWIGVFSDGETRPQVTVDGDMTLANFARLLVGSGAEDASSVTTIDELLASGGALVTVGGELSLAARSLVIPICQPVSGGAPWFKAGAVTIDANSAFDATGVGYETYANIGGSLPTAEKVARGAGGGVPTTIKVINTKYAGAGGYGGNGGNATNIDDVAYGMAYGSPYAPLGPGSTGPNGESCVAWGSGSVRIFTTGVFTLDGALVSKGFRYATNWSWASSGGAVWVIAKSFAGGESAAMNVAGGNGGGNGSPGAGGGRISVWTCKKPEVIDRRNLQALLAGELGDRTKALDVQPASWLGTATAAAGVSDKDGNTVTVTQPQDGTITYLDVPKQFRGFSLLVK